MTLIDGWGRKREPATKASLQNFSSATDFATPNVAFPSPLQPPGLREFALVGLIEAKSRLGLNSLFPSSPSRGGW